VRASGQREQDRLADLAFEVEDDALEVCFIEDLLALSSAEKERATAEVVDLASDALGVIVDASEESVTKESALASSDAQVVFGITCGFLQVKGFEVEADGDALVEGFVGSETELVGQVRLTEQDEGDQGSGVHLVVEQEAQLVKELRRQEVRLIDDEEDVAALAGQVVEGGAELWKETHKAESRLNLESEKDLTVECGDAKVRIGEIDHGIEVAVKGLSESAHGGRFAGADVAGDECGETVLEGEGQAALDFTVTARGIEVLGGDRLGKGRMRESVKVIEAGHGRFSPGVG
jgi:hypothetical protein